MSKDKLIDQELIDFANEFARTRKYISAGGAKYVSDNGKYKLHYYDELRDMNEYSMIHGEILMPNPNFGGAVTTPGRVHCDTGVIEISRNRLRSKFMRHEDFVFSLVLWCAIRVNFPAGEYGDHQCDTATLQCYKQQLRDYDTVYRGWTEVLRHRGDQYANRRVIHIRKALFEFHE